MFNVSNDIAATRYQRYFLRLMETFERKMRPGWFLILQNSFEEAAKNVEHGNQDMDSVINQHRVVVNKKLVQDYRNILAYFGTFTFDQFEKQYKKSIRIPSKKGMEDIYWESVKEWAAASALKKARDISSSTRQLINGIIQRGMRDGLSNDELVKQLREKRKTFNKVRATRIVRTETHSAANKAVNEGVKSTNYSHNRIWRATRDDRVRGRDPKDIVNHLRANRQLRDLETPFDISGDKLDFPGDPKVRPAQTVNCIVSPKAPIFTSKGWKQINQIEVGDMVLTHKNRFRKVSRLSRSVYQGDMIQFSVLNMMRPQGRVAVTPEHPFLVNKEWIKAKDLKIGDSVQVMAAFCGFCGKAIPWWDKFCDISCSSKKTTEKQWSDFEHRKNMSEKAAKQMNKEYADGTRDKKEITKQARKNCQKKYGSGGYLGHAMKDRELRKDLRSKRKEAIIEKYGSEKEMILSTAMPGLGRKARGGTAIEISMQKYLTKNGRAFVKQFRVGRRFVDFYIAEENLFIECDGTYWHQDKLKERKRDLEILSEYPDHTIAHVTYGNPKPEWEHWTLVDLMQLNHDGVYKQIAMPIVSIDKKPVKQGKWNKKTVYNFAVEEDESYIVNGLVSHNCRCVLTYHTKRI